MVFTRWQKLAIGIETVALQSIQWAGLSDAQHAPRVAHLVEVHGFFPKSVL